MTRLNLTKTLLVKLLKETYDQKEKANSLYDLARQLEGEIEGRDFRNPDPIPELRVLTDGRVIANRKFEDGEVIPLTPEILKEILDGRG